MAYLAWYEDFEPVRDPAKIGKVDHYFYIPPDTGPADAEAWNWYHSNCTAFSIETGILARLFEALGLAGIYQELFLLKISLIHSMYVRIARRRAEEQSANKG